MSEIRLGGELVRKFLIEDLDAHPADIVKVAGERSSTALGKLSTSTLSGW